MDNDSISMLKLIKKIIVEKNEAHYLDMLDTVNQIDKIINDYYKEMDIWADEQYAAISKQDESESLCK